MYNDLYGIYHEREYDIRVKIPVKEDDTRFDDADVEIIDLDDLREPARPELRAPAVSRSQGWTRRHRQMLTTASAALVALAILLILVSSGSIRGLVGGIFERHNSALTP